MGLFCIQFLLMVSSLIGFALTHFGQFSKTASKTLQDFWWYFFTSMTIWYNIYFIIATFDFIGFMKGLQKGPETSKTNRYKKYLNLSTILLTIGDFAIFIIELFFPYLVLFTTFH